MKHILFCVVFVSGFLVLRGQNRFLFIHEPARSPFYVRMEESSFSSSPAGHLMLGNLSDSVYSMFIGFPGTRYPEHLFAIKIEGRERGLELRNSGVRWNLVDIQSGDVIEPVWAGEKAMEGEKRTDTYSQLMAGVVNDTAVQYKRIIDDTAAVKPPDSVAASAVQDSATVRGERVQQRQNINSETPATNSDTAVTGAIGNSTGTNKKGESRSPERDVADPLIQATLDSARAAAFHGPVYDKRDIIRFGTENVVEGKLMIYLDRSGPVTDTIRIIIPRL